MSVIFANVRDVHQTPRSPAAARDCSGGGSGYDAGRNGGGSDRSPRAAGQAQQGRFAMHEQEYPADERTAALVAGIQRGESAALAAYLDHFRRPLLAYIERHLGDGLRRKVEPDDMFQEMSADALRSLGQVELAERDPFGWLCQIAERRIIDAHRRYFGAQKRSAGREVSIHGGGGSAETSRAGLVDLLVASMTSASRAVSRDEKQVKMLAALESLSPDQREAVRLRYLEGWPSKKIADHLGKTDGAIRVMLTRSLSKLQSLLDPNGTWQSR